MTIVLIPNSRNIAAEIMVVSLSKQTIDRRMKSHSLSSSNFCGKCFSCVKFWTQGVCWPEQVHTREINDWKWITVSRLCKPTRIEVASLKFDCPAYTQPASHPKIFPSNAMTRTSFTVDCHNQRMPQSM